MSYLIFLIFVLNELMLCKRRKV